MTTTTMTSTQVGATGQEHKEYNMEDAPNTPTTPRAYPHPELPAHSSTSPAANQPSDSQSGIQGQKPLPTSPFPGNTTPDHSEKGSSKTSATPKSDTMDLDDSEEEEEGSGDETEGEQTGKMSKKKKGQRFFCTDFPPCNLSFTRSEHLARHIRKHTGERPFQCHCNRRFSRLDNLRQHAQTVHVNEDIPGDSLAATGTRFQRQIRTDRVRPPGARARSGTTGSQGSHSRGHSRNLSTSSIGSTASNFSATPEPRRRPPPLIMANDPSRSRMSADASSPPTTPTSQYTGYPGDSPGGFSTPTSTAYSTGPGSPTFGSNYASPSRSGLFGGPPPARRLSVPASGNPFMSPHSHSGPPPYMSPLAPSNLYSSSSSVFGSPTSSNFSFSRADPNLSAEAEWRRRTWHPTTYTYSGNVMNYSRPATSGLSYSQTPDAPQLAFATNATAAAGPAPRLPGIESFDQVQHRPSTPPRRQLSPLRGDPGSTQPAYTPQNSALRSHPSGPDHRRGHVSWDLSMDSNMSRLDLQGNVPKDASQWGQQTLTEIHEVASRPHQADRPPPVVSQQAVLPGPPSRPQLYGHDAQTATHQRSKRHGWYNGPLQPAAQVASTSRTSPEDSSSSDGVPTPGTSAAEYHPAIVHSNGYVEHHHPVVPADGPSIPCAPPQAQSHPNYISHHAPPSRAEYYNAPPPPRHDLGRLEALVAVATSEDNAATTAR